MGGGSLGERKPGGAGVKGAGLGGSKGAGLCVGAWGVGQWVGGGAGGWERYHCRQEQFKWRFLC